MAPQRISWGSDRAVRAMAPAPLANCRKFVAVEEHFVSVSMCCIRGELIKLLGAVGSAAVLFNGIKESSKILSQFKLCYQKTFRNHNIVVLCCGLEIAKKPFLCRQR